MYNSTDFINDFIEKGYHRSSEKRVTEILTYYFEGVDAEIIDLIVRKMKSKQLKGMESSHGSGALSSSMNQIRFPIHKDDKSTFFHEFGHVIDYIRLDRWKEGSRIKYKQYFFSGYAILSCGECLHDIVRKEVNEKKEVLLKVFEKTFDEKVLTPLGEDFREEHNLYLSISKEDKNLKNKHASLCKKNLKESEEAKKIRKRREEISNIYKEHNYFNPHIKELIRSEHSKKFIETYDVLIDMLSGVYDIRNYCVGGHTRSYMNHEVGFGNEFFADVFSAEMTKNEKCLEIVKEFFPKSYEAYKELLDIIKAQK